MFKARGIIPSSISEIKGKLNIYGLGSRATELREGFEKQNPCEQFVIIDDDLSIHGLPYGIKKNCVLTNSMIGLDEKATNKVLEILLENN